MAEETTTQPGLTVQDLSLTLQVIQVATSRGAFKADELSAIGGLYDRIFKFLEVSGAITKDEPKTEAAAPEVAQESKPAAAKSKGKANV